MSSLTAFFTVCVVIAVVTPVLLWQIHRAWKVEQAKNQAAASYEHTYADGPDDQPGTDLALHDECALIYSLPAYSPASDRLKKRIVSDPYYEAAFRRIADDELHPDLADFAKRLLDEAHEDDDTTTNPTGD